ncbi:MAG TPA: ATP-dependent Clp protease adaptor ClpS [Edaphocola sp.]|nr:ATP-dependent Clp protease adaptor ClpS [Edaphocola sp.]
MIFLENNNISWDGNPGIKEDTDVLVDEQEELYNSLIVWNDEINTFDWVIDSLVEICGHTVVSAEQCAMIIHFSGKYAVKKGSFDDLKPQCEALLDRGISASID